jgi:hypothetical protein
MRECKLIIPIDEKEPNQRFSYFCDVQEINITLLSV